MEPDSSWGSIAEKRDAWCMEGLLTRQALDKLGARQIGPQPVRMTRHPSN